MGQGSSATQSKIMKLLTIVCLCVLAVTAFGALGTPEQQEEFAQMESLFEDLSNRIQGVDHLTLPEAAELCEDLEEGLGTLAAAAALPGPYQAILQRYADGLGPDLTALKARVDGLKREGKGERRDKHHGISEQQEEFAQMESLFEDLSNRIQGVDHLTLPEATKLCEDLEEGLETLITVAALPGPNQGTLQQYAGDLKPKLATLRARIDGLKREGKRERGGEHHDAAERQKEYIVMKSLYDQLCEKASKVDFMTKDEMLDFRYELEDGLASLKVASGVDSPFRADLNYYVNKLESTLADLKARIGGLKLEGKKELGGEHHGAPMMMGPAQMESLFESLSKRAQRVGTMTIAEKCKLCKDLEEGLESLKIASRQLGPHKETLEHYVDALQTELAPLLVEIERIKFPTFILPGKPSQGHERALAGAGSSLMHAGMQPKPSIAAAAAPGGVHGSGEGAPLRGSGVIVAKPKKTKKLRKKNGHASAYSGGPSHKRSSGPSAAPDAEHQ